MERSGPEEGPAFDAVQLGERLRAARERNGIGLRELSRRVQLSASMISQLERGLTMPSVTTLYAVTTALGSSLDELVGAPRTAAGAAAPALAGAPPVTVPAGGALARPTQLESAPLPVARHASPRRIALEDGVRWELLAATPSPDVEFMRVTYEPGGASAPADALQRHDGSEYGHVAEGRLGVTVGFHTYELEAGDSISFASTMPHRLFNLLDDRPTTGFWVVVGRSARAHA
ncbi:XRE family transcriptional regulator [Conexibacter stalactiti]|uniref:XRE family transcriptional regulator n=1 Tax=Conexibacter stalactiti TaxID=1940611 RepID=A0ABU4HMH2_9ACTN|nr:XRE family transcriptional regulator [Conexibacter stalactiti]MDW5594511.1 XRE family transcriptional regulator [Conexibacter stalactiti]MEC5035153.1 XRE family transcriptional regulator [Conexibacter stalactiti]